VSNAGPAAATEALDTSGEVSFNAIAKRAGIGVGTVYRHFPTPEALVLAVYHREVRHLVDVVPDLLESSTPEQAFRAWTGHLAHYVMTKRALATALRTATPHDGNVHETILSAVSKLLEANVRAGSVRADLDPETLLRGLSGVLHFDPGDDWPSQTESLIDLLWRGMRAEQDT
jgi:AcrR family transcriptional regulator